MLEMVHGRGSSVDIFSARVRAGKESKKILSRNRLLGPQRRFACMCNHPEGMNEESAHGTDQRPQRLGSRQEQLRNE